MNPKVKSLVQIVLSFVVAALCVGKLWFGDPNQTQYWGGLLMTTLTLWLPSPSNDCPPNDASTNKASNE